MWTSWVIFSKDFWIIEAINTGLEGFENPKIMEKSKKMKNIKFYPQKSGGLIKI